MPKFRRCSSVRRRPLPTSVTPREVRQSTVYTLARSTHVAASEARDARRSEVELRKTTRDYLDTSDEHIDVLQVVM